jgi:tetratricopeptide (TPR) repeat protein
MVLAGEATQPPAGEGRNFSQGEVPAKEARSIPGMRPCSIIIFPLMPATAALWLGKILIARKISPDLQVKPMTSALPRPFVPVTQLLTAVLQIGAEHHRAGRHDAARAMYQEVLELDPRHADALFLLGVLERQAGRLELAQKVMHEAARWAADRSRIETELRLIQQLLRRQNLKPMRRWADAAPFSSDCSALSIAARA